MMMFGREIVKLLLRNYKDLVDQKDAGGKTALHFVASNNLPMIVDDLVAASHVWYLKDNYGLTALHVAAYAGNVDVMVKLLEHYPNLWNIRNAVDGNKELLIQEDSVIGDTPLHYIARYGCYVEELMNIGELDRKMLNFENITPLDILLDGTGKATVGDQEAIRTKLNANAEFWRLGRERTLEPEDYLKNAKNAKKIERHNNELRYIKNSIDNHMVVASLIVTVS